MRDIAFSFPLRDTRRRVLLLDLDQVPIRILDGQQLGEADQLLALDEELTLGLVFGGELAEAKGVLDRGDAFGAQADALGDVDAEFFHALLGLLETRHHQPDVAEGVGPLGARRQARVF